MAEQTHHTAKYIKEWLLKPGSREAAQQVNRKRQDSSQRLTPEDALLFAYVCSNVVSPDAPNGKCVLVLCPDASVVEALYSTCDAALSRLMGKHVKNTRCLQKNKELCHRLAKGDISKNVHETKWVVLAECEVANAEISGTQDGWSCIVHIRTPSAVTAADQTVRDEVRRWGRDCVLELRLQSLTGEEEMDVGTVTDRGSSGLPSGLSHSSRERPRRKRFSDLPAHDRQKIEQHKCMLLSVLRHVLDMNFLPPGVSEEDVRAEIEAFSEKGRDKERVHVVYVMKERLAPVSADLLKIGFTTLGTDQREKVLAIGNPRGLRTIFCRVLYGVPFALEEEMHKAFISYGGPFASAADRERLYIDPMATEWFRVPEANQAEVYQKLEQLSMTNTVPPEERYDTERLKAIDIRLHHDGTP